MTTPREAKINLKFVKYAVAAMFIVTGINIAGADVYTLWPHVICGVIGFVVTLAGFVILMR